MYNIMFSSMPIVWFAVFDFQFEKSQLLSESKHYKVGLNDKCFGTKVFWQWFSLGTVQAFVLMYICLYAQEVTVRPDGLASSLWVSGSLVYAGVVIIVNQKLLMDYNNYNHFGVFLIFLSILCYFLFLFLENLPIFGIEQILGIFSFMMTNPMSYFAILFMILYAYSEQRVLDYFSQL